ncbi:unnamed protein product [Bursaphelenchus okinawaensis]|uniref:Uncharacterized protein n=1 Tax=Bursaphelenchus okinawaensis TaxID=465554 RepID=A0A811JRL0_9BILA|nr:unnamed protein product [Bursaphelenchus okinawaensis]CAG9079188.1 unnamed protein product [Bursaphelenchus okinawaensis]
MSQRRCYPIPRPLTHFDASRPTNSNDVRRFLEADKELLRIKNVSPCTNYFRRFMKDLQLRVVEAPDFLDERGGEERPEQLEKLPSVIKSSRSGDSEYREVPTCSRRHDMSSSETDVESGESTPLKLIHPELEMALNEGSKINLSQLMGRSCRARRAQPGSNKSSKESDEYQSKPLQFASKKPSKTSQARNTTLDLLSKKGVRVVNSTDFTAKRERIVETCPKHKKTHAYEILRKKHAIEVYEVKAVDSE